MSQVATQYELEELQSSHAIGTDPTILRKVLQPEVNLSLWRRPVNEDIQSELAALCSSDLPDVRCSTSLQSFGTDVENLLRVHGLDPSELRNWCLDLEMVADHYFSICGRKTAMLRLETTMDDGCRRFHADRTRLRLLCTYQGPGTEWLSNEQVDRAAHRSGASNEEIVRFGDAENFKPFWVGILKGTKYPGNAKLGLVHRSPPMKNVFKTRVVVCLDS